MHLAATPSDSARETSKPATQSFLPRYLAVEQAYHATSSQRGVITW
jgi:hypothetical protein